MMKLFGQAFIKKMNARVDTHKTRVIHALDVANTFTPDAPESARKELIERACHIATAVEPHVVAIKLNYPLVLAVGLEIVQYLKKLHPDLPLIADFKVADIDNTNAWIARHTYSAGIDAIIVQGFIGEDAIQGVIQEAKKAGDQGIILVRHESSWRCPIYPSPNSSVNQSSQETQSLRSHCSWNTPIPSTRDSESPWY
jgi:orotidine-5'-phosphate decarboxylase